MKVGEMKFNLLLCLTNDFPKKSFTSSYFYYSFLNINLDNRLNIINKMAVQMSDS
jgi:hypothetical protein